VVSTDQAITGPGIRAVRQMENERAGVEGEMIYPHAIDKNCIPHCDSFTENGYTKEEMKLLNETHKIFGDPSITVSPTAVRVPVVGGHSESINVETVKPFTMDDVRGLLERAEGVKVVDNPAKNEYPMAIHAHNHDEVFVGRLRQDISNPMAMNMWVVADNLRKGAATNAVQIAQLLLLKGYSS
jgi:aspartate-semialdehyde dehydrogenase